LPGVLKLLLDFSFWQELLNLQDKTTQNEVEEMRHFAKSTFQSFRVEEVADVKFGDYGDRQLTSHMTLVCRYLQLHDPEKGKKLSGSSLSQTGNQNVA
jgi:hypothetical protein